MADEEKDGRAAAPAAAGGKQLMVLALAMMLTMAGSVAGAVYWLMKSGRLPVQAAGVAAKAETAKEDPPKTRMLLLDPLLVNLADTGGAGYLRLVVVLRVEEPPPVKGEKPKEEKPPEKGKVVVNEDEARLRDAALAVLGRETSERLLAPEGKARLKDELRAAFEHEVPEVKITDILYTEFLVQR
jgi:flagellar FliL protein